MLTRVMTFDVMSSIVSNHCTEPFIAPFNQLTGATVIVERIARSVLAETVRTELLSGSPVREGATVIVMTRLWMRTSYHLNGL